MIPGGSVIIGHLAMMKEPDFQKSLHNFSVKHADENGRCTFYMGPTTPALSVTRADDVQALLKISSHRTLFPVFQQHSDQFLGKHNIGVLTGKEWKNQRATIMKALHGSAFQQNNIHAIKVATTRLIDRLASESQVQDIGIIMQFLTLDIFGQAALHCDFGCCESLQPSRIMQSFNFLASEMMRRVSKDIMNPASHLYSLPTPANKKHAEERAYIRGYIADLIRKRRELMREQPDKSPQDLLSSLIQNANNSSDDELSEETLSDVMLSLLFAGFETTSVTLTYVFYMLSQHPDVEQHCLDEIAAVDDWEKCLYLKAVIRETMRLYPPAISTTRSLERDVEIGDGIQVKKGTYLYFPIWIIQRDARNFANPLKFDPERWVKRVDGNWNERNHSKDDPEAGNLDAFVAFSSGARSCAGQRFALQEMVIVLSTMMPKLRFEPPKDYVLKPHRDGLVQSPQGGIPMKIVQRG